MTMHYPPLHCLTPTTQVAILCLALSGFPSFSAKAPDVEELIPPAFNSGFTPSQPARDSGSTTASKNTLRYNHGDPTVYEQLMLEMVNRARSDPGVEAASLGIDLNEGLPAGTIDDAPKQPLGFHPALISAARGHSQWMLDNDVFSHTGVDGTDPGDRMRNAGYLFSGSWSWGENISWGGTTGTPDIERYTIARHERLFLSAGHRKNLCKAAFDEIGLGILEGVFTSVQPYNAVMATQKFARSDSTPGPLLLGVVFEDADGDGFYDPGEGVPGITVCAESQQHYAVTTSSGGYAFPHTHIPGLMNVHFSGPSLPVTVSRTVDRTGENIKLDLNITDVRVIGFSPGTLCYSEALGFQCEVSGSPNTDFQLLHSTDLVDWVEVRKYTLSDSPVRLDHEPQDASAAHFYRLAWDP